MPLSNLPFTVRQLEVFASVCATRSFRQTSEDLGISQASVSGQIKTLEKQLGFTLFKRRSGMNPVLTIPGTNFLQDFHSFEQAADRLASHRRQKPSAEEPVMYRVRVGQALLERFIRPRLGEFFASNPAIELDFDAQPPGSHPAQEVIGGRYDFGLFHVRAAEPLPSYLRSLALVRGGIYGHKRFAEGRELPLSPEEISGLPFVLPKAGSRLEKASLSSMANFGIVPKHVVGHSPYFDVQATLIASGIGVASFSDALLSLEQRADVIMLRRLADWRLVFFRKSDRADRRLQAVEDFVISSVLENDGYPVND